MIKPSMGLGSFNVCFHYQGGKSHMLHEEYIFFISSVEKSKFIVQVIPGWASLKGDDDTEAQNALVNTSGATFPFLAST